MEPNKKKLTTASGRPYAENENSQTAGPSGPILFRTISCMKKWPILTASASLSVLYMQKVQAHTAR
jgi:hypothetical protein